MLNLKQDKTMTNFKGTKGDWKVKHDPTISNFPHVEIAPNRVIIVEGTNHIEPDYNALLISKSPKMLEFLEELSNAPKDLNPVAWIQKANQLIKEATSI